MIAKKSCTRCRSVSRSAGFARSSPSNSFAIAGDAFVAAVARSVRRCAGLSVPKILRAASACLVKLSKSSPNSPSSPAASRIARTACWNISPSRRS
jgi:hypothetical protein